MSVPVDITFRGMTTSEAVEDAVRKGVERLEHVHHRVTRCSVVIEMPHRHHRHGQTFHVRIELAVPERTISVNRDPGLDHGHEDVYVAIADAFRAARRQLDDYNRIQRGDIKAHG